MFTTMMPGIRTCAKLYIHYEGQLETSDLAIVFSHARRWIFYSGTLHGVHKEIRYDRIGFNETAFCAVPNRHFIAWHRQSTSKCPLCFFRCVVGSRNCHKSTCNISLTLKLEPSMIFFLLQLLLSTLWIVCATLTMQWLVLITTCNGFVCQISIIFFMYRIRQREPAKVRAGYVHVSSTDASGTSYGRHSPKPAQPVSLAPVHYPKAIHLTKR